MLEEQPTPEAINLDVFRGQSRGLGLAAQINDCGQR